MKIVGVIPARFGSTRFPGKPLAAILGKPMIQHVYERVSLCRSLDEVVVATDHEKIAEAVQSFNGNVVMTSQSHETGSDRMAEVTTKVDGDFYINIQGDEPLIGHELIEQIITEAKRVSGAVITAKKKIDHIEDIDNPNVVKVVTDTNGQALYFSRSTVPFNRSKSDCNYYKHLGIYGYPKRVIQEFVKLNSSSLERAEVLEQLRLLENGYKIQVVETQYDAVGVDTPEDIEKVENLLGGLHHV